jgi:peptide/nickel transport system substrate-binding protein
VREALDVAVDRERIINEVLGGFGTPLIGPLPSSFEAEYLSSEERLVRGRALLAEDGWERNEAGELRRGKNGEEVLSLTIKTGNAPELQSAARIVKESWEALGAAVSLELYEASDLQQNVIRPREYEAVFFGLVIQREPDLFAFWHSSQRNDPGLNIALYTNITTDSVLAKTRHTNDRREREELFLQFAHELSLDTPAVFTHTPNFVYLHPKDLRGLPHIPIVVPSDRFVNVHEWYRDTERVWPLFIQN